jgi:hypothetical protein
MMTNNDPHVGGHLLHGHTPAAVVDWNVSDGQLAADPLQVCGGCLLTPW